MGKSKLYWQHFLLTVSMVLVSFALLAMVFISMSYQYTIQENKKHMEANADHLASLTSTLLMNGHSTQDEIFRIYISSAAAISSNTLIIANYDGEMVYCSDTSVFLSDAMEVLIPRYIREDIILDSAYNAMTTFDGQLKETSFAVGRPVDVQTVGGVLTVAMVFVVSPAESFVDLWGDFAAIFFAAAMAVLIFSLFSASITANRQTKPLQDMAQAAQAFGRGQFDVRVPDEGGHDEIALLGRAFNSMADSLSQSETRRQEFVANISHELKTPMTTISGFVDGILDGTIPQERAPEYLQVVSSETKRLARLVRKMLDISQLQAEERAGGERFDIVEVISQVLISMEQRITGRGLDVEASLPEEPVLVQGSTDDITQVCYNLLDNAVKFSTPGTAIGVSVTTKGSKALVSVRNHGETIPPEEQSAIFDRFHKTDHSRSMDKEGVGLGLYIVKTILNAHKEKIALSSEAGVTEFVFSLTLAQPLREK